MTTVGKTRTQPATWCAAILPSRAHTTRMIGALETTMHTLAVDAKHPVSLEIVGTAQDRFFMVRATTQDALRHLVTQIRAQYPQAKVQDVRSDPLLAREDEAVSVIELKAGAASYLALRSWGQQDLQGEGADPVLGLMAGLNHLPTSLRLLAQLALVPTVATWSSNDWRKTVEHPLEPERKTERNAHEARSRTPSFPLLFGLMALVVFASLWRFEQHQLLRVIPWILPLMQAVSALQHGHLDLFSSGGRLVFWVSVGVATALLGAMRFLRIRFGRVRSFRIYDMRQVDEKIKRFAYHARLRLIACGPSARRARSWKQLQVLARHLHTRTRLVSVRSSWQIVILSRRLHRAHQHVFELRPQRAHAFFRTRWKMLSIWERQQRRWLRKRGLVPASLRITWIWAHDQIRYHRDQQRLHQERLAYLRPLAAAYQQYHQAKGGFFRIHVVSSWSARNLVRVPTGWFSWGQGWSAAIHRSPHILSAIEVASLWHLPQAHDLADLPLVSKELARTFLVPKELVTMGQDLAPRVGLSLHAGYALPVFLPARMLYSNMLAVASTGKGKSTLFQHLAEVRLSHLTMAKGSSPARRESLFVIDPHGDFVTTLAGRVPDPLVDQVVLIDLATAERPLGLNLLDMSQGQDRDKIVDNLIVTFHALWDQSWGTRTENILEFALKSLAEVNGQLPPEQQYTILDVVPLLRNAGFRRTVVDQVQDETIKQWWEHYYELMHPNYQTEVIGSVINKMSKYSSSRIARRILGQPRSTIHFREIIMQGQIVFISTASGMVGSDLSSLIGATLLNLFQAALAEQAAVAQEQRSQYLLIIDEFQTFLGADYQSMLSELRKYGGSFALATQSLTYLDRVSDSLRATVLANSDHLFAFDMSGDDAKLLLPELDGLVEVEDVTNLDNYCCYAKLSLDGRRLPLFSLALDPPAAGDAHKAECLSRASAQRYGSPVAGVDACIAQRLASLRAQVPSHQPEEPLMEVPSLVQTEVEQQEQERLYIKKRGTYGAKSAKKGRGELPLRDQTDRLLSTPLADFPAEERGRLVEATVPEEEERKEQGGER